MTDVKLPPFPHHPEPYIMAWREDEIEAIKAYATAAVMAERERCAKVCEAIAAPMFDHAKPPYLKAANAIRQPPEGGEG